MMILDKVFAKASMKHSSVYHHVYIIIPIPAVSPYVYIAWSNQTGAPSYMCRTEETAPWLRSWNRFSMWHADMCCDYAT